MSVGAVHRLATGGILLFAFTAMSGCGAAPEGPGPPAPNLIVFTSNQASDLPWADLRIEVAGLLLIDGPVHVGDNHNWTRHELTVPPGTHRIEAYERTTQTGRVEDVQVSAKATRWAIVDFYHPYTPYDGYPEDTPGFSVDVFGSEPIFG